MMNREDHLEWAKERAHQFVRFGDLQGAVNSMSTDLMKHPEFDKENVAFKANAASFFAVADGNRAVTAWIDGWL